jgi:cob(I)alamin adenosyltransferase
VLELVYELAKLKTQEQKECLNGLDQKVFETYEKIMKTAYMHEITREEKIDQIVKDIDQYHKEIENLREHITPTTPPTVREQRNQ